MVAVQFSILRADGSKVDENALTTADLEDLPGVEGRLVIEHDGDATDMGDTLGLLMEEFCLRGLTTLRSTGAHEIDFMDHEEIVTLSSAGAVVTVSGERFGHRSYPADAYVAAMAGCGQRYVGLLRTAWAGNAERQDDLAALEAQLV